MSVSHERFELRSKGRPKPPVPTQALRGLKASFILSFLIAALKRRATPKAEVAVSGETHVGLVALSRGRALFDSFINYDGIYTTENVQVL